MFGGALTISEAQATVKQVNNMCMTGGFTLQKWISYKPSTLQILPAEKHIYYKNSVH